MGPKNWGSILKAITHKLVWDFSKISLDTPLKIVFYTYVESFIPCNQSNNVAIQQIWLNLTRWRNGQSQRSHFLTALMPHYMRRLYQDWFNSHGPLGRSKKPDNQHIKGTCTTTVLYEELKRYTLIDLNELSSEMPFSFLGNVSLSSSMGRRTVKNQKETLMYSETIQIQGSILNINWGYQWCWF